MTKYRTILSEKLLKTKSLRLKINVKFLHFFDILKKGFCSKSQLYLLNNLDRLKLGYFILTGWLVNARKKFKFASIILCRWPKITAVGQTDRFDLYTIEKNCGPTVFKLSIFLITSLNTFA